MAYAGGLLDTPLTDAQVGRFLQAALRAVTPERPFRGPSEFHQDDFAYFDDGYGDIERFWGVERILYKERPAYELRYAGGALR